MARFKIYNGPSPTTAAQAVVTTGTAIKTMLQVQVSATLGAHIVEWGISFDGAAMAAAIKCELIETDVAATVTAHVTAGIVRLDGAAVQGGDPVTNLILVGTAATGYTSSAEGTTTVSRVFDAQLVDPAVGYVMQFPLGERPYMKPGTFFTRVRVTAAAAVNAYCYVVLEV
jgi:hypothetical protein